MAERISTRIALRSCSDPLGLHRFERFQKPPTTLNAAVSPTLNAIRPPSADWSFKAISPKTTEALRITALDLLGQLIFRNFSVTVPLADIHPLYAGSNRQFVFAAKPYAESRIGKPYSSRRPDDFRAWFPFELAALIRDIESGKVLVMKESDDDHSDDDQEMSVNMIPVSGSLEPTSSLCLADSLIGLPSIERRAITPSVSITSAPSRKKAYTLGAA